MVKKKKIPLRKCIGCQQQKEKRELVRILRQEDGSLMLDPTGRMNGRGAYICRSSNCLAQARKNHGLERSFQCQIPSQVWDTLAEEIEQSES